jgi:hypothetical protein
MGLDLVVRFPPLSEVEGSTTSAAQKSRLVLESGGAPASDGGPERATIAVLGPIDVRVHYLPRVPSSSDAFLR